MSLAAPPRAVFRTALVAAALVASLVILTGAQAQDGSPTPSERPTADDAAEPGTSSPAATPSPSGAPLFGGFDKQIRLLTPESGGGTRPLLEWEEVDGAAHYAAYLYAPSGALYWVWTGSGSAIHVGGEPQLREEAPGPSVTEGMSWVVVAYSDIMVPIAVSPQRPISP